MAISNYLAFEQRGQLNTVLQMAPIIAILFLTKVLKVLSMEKHESGAPHHFRSLLKFKTLCS